MCCAEFCVSLHLRNPSRRFRDFHGVCDIGNWQQDLSSSWSYRWTYKWLSDVPHQNERSGMENYLAPKNFITLIYIVYYSSQAISTFFWDNIACVVRGRVAINNKHLNGLIFFNYRVWLFLLLYCMRLSASTLLGQNYTNKYRALGCYGNYMMFSNVLNVNVKLVMYLNGLLSFCRIFVLR